MTPKEGRLLGEKICQFVAAKQIEPPYALLAPVLAQQIHFPVLDAIGEIIGNEPLKKINPFLEKIANEKSDRGWFVIATALNRQLDRDLPGAFFRCHHFISLADVWYGADIFGKRVPGPALLSHYNETFELLKIWQNDPNRWVRLAVGIGVNFWLKRAKGTPEFYAQAKPLVRILETMFG